jgi:hypothetical protein
MADMLKLAPEKLLRRTLPQHHLNEHAILLIDEQAALAALPSLLPPDAETRSEAFDAVKQVVEACGETSEEDEKRLNEIGRLFGIAEEGATIPFLQIRRFQAKAS